MITYQPATDPQIIRMHFITQPPRVIRSARGYNHVLLMRHWRWRCETGVKDIKICIHATAGPERAMQMVFSTTHHYFCVTDI